MTTGTSITDNDSNAENDEKICELEDKDDSSIGRNMNGFIINSDLEEKHDIISAYVIRIS